MLAIFAKRSSLTRNYRGERLVGPQKASYVQKLSHLRSLLTPSAIFTAPKLHFSRAILLPQQQKFVLSWDIVDVAISELPVRAQIEGWLSLRFSGGDLYLCPSQTPDG